VTSNLPTRSHPGNAWAKNLPTLLRWSGIKNADKKALTISGPALFYLDLWNSLY
jgi:hypothetical protein